MKVRSRTIILVLVVLASISIPFYFIQNNEQNTTNSVIIQEEVKDTERIELINGIWGCLSETDDIDYAENSQLSDIVKVYGASGRQAQIDARPYRKYFEFPEEEKGFPIFFVNDLGNGKYPGIIADENVMNSNNYLNSDEKINVIAILGEEIENDIFLLDNDAARIEDGLFNKQIRSIGGEILSMGEYLPYVTICLPHSELKGLAALSNVAYISLDHIMKPMIAEAVPIVKESAGWAQIESNLGRSINGTGMTIAILDTGIDASHPDLDDLDDDPLTNDPKVILARDFTNDSNPMDFHGHGTHCASIAAGTGEASSGQFVGMAPGAYLLNGKILARMHGGVLGYESWCVDAIQWAVFNGADVISMSIGYGLYSEGFDIISVAVDWAASWAVSCVIAAGNEGTGLRETIDYPGCARGAITVGAMDKNYNLPSWSSKGVTMDGRIKPDVVAPGVDITAARATGTSMGSIVNQFYTNASGTSMATPLVAGAVALLQEVHPSWNPKMIKASMVNTGEIGFLYDPAQFGIPFRGGGLVDLVGACNSSIIASESSISFGRVTVGDTPTIQIELRNMINVLSPPIDVYFNTKSVYWPTKTPNNNLKTDVSMVSISYSSSELVELSLNTILSTDKEGHYQGELLCITSDRNYSIPVYYIIVSSIDDSYENNDLPSSAYDVSLNYGRWLSQINGYGHQNDHDFYKFYVPRWAQLVTIEVKAITAGAWLRFEVSNGSSMYMDDAGDFGDVGQVTTLGLSPGYNYIRIKGIDENQLYDFRIKSMKNIPDDNYEENDGPNNPTNIIGHQGRWLYDLNGNATALDPDWYIFWGDASRINVTFAISGYAFPELYDRNLNLLTDTFWYGDYLVYNLTYTGIYYIRFDPIPGLRGYKYYFRYFCGTPQDDNYEENDYWTEPTNITTIEGNWLSSIDGYGIGNDADWYIFETDPAKPYVKIDLEIFNGDRFYVCILDEWVRIMVEEFGIDSDKSFYIEKMMGGTRFYVVVVAYSLEQNYDLRWKDVDYQYTPISLPFSFTGAGEYFWVSDSLPEYINSWNLQLLEINGMPFTNQYKFSHQLPAAIGGKYYIHYISANPNGHFEAGNSVPSVPGSTSINTPFYFGGAGEYYWETDSIPDHISSWELQLLEINGVVVTNQYIHSNQLPPKIAGKYYIHYVGTAFGHFEAV